MAERSPAEEARQVKRVDKKEFAAGDTVYLVDTTWLEQWKRYSNYDVEGAGDVPGGDLPGPITNAALVEKPTGWRRRVPQLNAEVREGSDYTFVTAAMWKLLHGWYGGGPAMPRPVYSEDEFGIKTKVEVRPQPCVLFTPLKDNGVAATIDESPVEDFGEEEAGGGAGGGAGADGAGEGEAAIEGSKLDESDLTDDIVAVLLSRSMTLGKAKKLFCEKLGKPVASTRVWSFVRPAGASDGKSGEWELVDDDQKVAELARNDAFTKFLVDTKTGGRWGRAHISDARHSEEVTDLPAWRAALKPGDRLDAKDGQDKWYESEIVEKGEDPDSGVPSYKVHFRAWESKWDAWIACNSNRLMPAWSKIDNFRDFRVTDKVEVKLETVKGFKWFTARVEEFDDDTVTVKGTTKYRDDKVTLPRDTELICPFPLHCKPEVVTYQPRRSGWNNWRSHTEGRPLHPGAVGLVNLGNTCFMNSMLQCLSNTQQLTEFFLSDRYKDDINRKNPLGMGGRLAEAYGDMLKAMWGDKYSVVCPSDLKDNIGKHAPQFAGYQQQDSQELMNFLLDGLHEDCNRVTDKPYREKVEGDGRPDEEVADLAWQSHLDRNQSEVLDIFGGQLRSEVHCDQCPKESITFDPFLSFSVPVPYNVTRQIIFTVYPYDGGVPTQYRPPLPIDGAIRDMKAWLQAEEGVEPDEVVMCPLLKNRLDDFFNDADPLTSIRSRDVCVGFRIPRAPALPEEAKDEETKDDGGKKRGVLGRAKDFLFGSSADNQRSRRHDHNHTGLIQIVFRKPVARSYSRADGALFGEPRVLSLFGTSGTHGVMPTNNQVHEAVWTVVHRLFSGDEWNAENAPYVLKVAPRGTFYESMEVPHDDELLSMGASPQFPVIVCDVTAENYRDYWDDAAYKACTHYSASESTKGRKTLTLKDCLNKAFEREQLAETDMWYCPDCKEHRTAFKKFDLWRLPEVLVVHMKRFQYRNAGYLNFVSRSKIDCQVDFPEELDLAEYALGPSDDRTRYELYAVSNHMGGMGGGHYTAYAKNFRNGKWYTFDDSHVSETSVTRVATPSAYVLFYKRMAKGEGGESKAVEDDSDAAARGGAGAATE